MGGVCGTACTGVGRVLVVVVVVVVGVASFVVVPAFGDDEDDENATARTPARTTEEAITTDLFSGSLMKAKALLSDAERLSIFQTVRLTVRLRSHMPLPPNFIWTHGRTSWAFDDNATATATRQEEEGTGK